MRADVEGVHPQDGRDEDSEMEAARLSCYSPDVRGEDNEMEEARLSRAGDV